MSQPTWLQSSFQQSHLALGLRTLDARETQRETARASRASSSRSRHPDFARSSHLMSNVKAYYSCSVGQQPSHKRKNRYLALEPYDRTRVLVPTLERRGHAAAGTEEDEAETLEPRYINANWVRESAGGNWWIAAQAPLPNTAHAFLTLSMCPVSPPPNVSSMSSSTVPPMRRVHTVVQLTLLMEGGRRRAHPYFPGAVHQNMIIEAEHGCDAPPIHVSVDKEERIDDAQCVKTDLRLRWSVSSDNNAFPGRDQEEWNVTHLLYTAWPDFGVPEDNSSILHFSRLVERVNNRHLSHPTNEPNSSPPILVHCSAGVGRTGSFIALSSLLRAYSLLSPAHRPSPIPRLAPPLPASPLGPLPRNLDDDLVAKEIDGLREQRQSMVQRDEQVVWVYGALSDAFEGL